MKPLAAIAPFESCAFIRVREDAEMPEARRKRLDEKIELFARTKFRLYDATLRKYVCYEVRRGLPGEIYAVLQSLPKEDRTAFEVFLPEKTAVTGMQVKILRAEGSFWKYLAPKK